MEDFSGAKFPWAVGIPLLNERGFRKSYTQGGDVSRSEGKLQPHPEKCSQVLPRRNF